MVEPLLAEPARLDAAVVVEDGERLPVLQDAPASMLDRLNRFPDLADLRADPRFKQLLASYKIR